MSSNVVLIGEILDYQTNFNVINSQIQKELLNVVGLVLSKSNYISIDNIPVYSSLTDIKDLDFDYFILLTENKEYYKIISDDNGFKQKIIPVRVFNLPYFNFNDYKQLIENPPSIISRHCWGGIVSHTLGLKFNTPFVNLFLNEVDFNKLAKNFSHYMNQELEFAQDGYDPILESHYPIVKLDDITLYFNHYSSFEEAKTKWEERKKRINYNNLLFETTTEYKSVALQFQSLELPQKICFCVDDFDSPDMINCVDLIPNFSQGKLGMFVNGTASGEIPFFNLIELLLNHNIDSRIKAPTYDNNERAFKYYKTTNWYKLEYNRFFGLDDELPWELDDKLEAYNFVENMGIDHPKIYYQLDDITNLKKLEQSDMLPDNFCLKNSNKSSDKLVMLLNKIEENVYYDYLSSKSYSLDEIIKIIQSNQTNFTQGNILYYIIEEFMDNFIENMKIPIGYKVFTFNGIPKFILQINRNSENYSIALFDGNFIPLKEGRDWFINHNYADISVPIIPPSAYEIINKSIEISKKIGNKLVMIDWVDNGEKPTFRELTFASRATVTGIFSLSREILLNLDNSLKQEVTTDFIEKGYRLNFKKLEKSLNNKLKFKTPEYDVLLEKCATGDEESLNEMVSYFEKLIINEKKEVVRKLYQHMEMAWLESLLLYNKLSTEKLCRQINAGWGFVFLKTFYYQLRINEAKEELFKLAIESDWYKIRWSQFIFDFGGNEEEVNKAKDYVNVFSEQKIQYALDVKEKYGL